MLSDSRSNSAIFNETGLDCPKEIFLDNMDSDFDSYTVTPYSAVTSL